MNEEIAKLLGDYPKYTKDIEKTPEYQQILRQGITVIESKWKLAEQLESKLYRELSKLGIEDELKHVHLGSIARENKGEEIRDAKNLTRLQTIVLINKRELESILTLLKSQDTIPKSQLRALLYYDQWESDSDWEGISGKSYFEDILHFRHKDERYTIATIGGIVIREKKPVLTVKKVSLKSGFQDWFPGLSMDLKTMTNADIEKFYKMQDISEGLKHCNLKIETCLKGEEELLAPLLEPVSGILQFMDETSKKVPCRFRDHSLILYDRDTGKKKLRN